MHFRVTEAFTFLFAFLSIFSMANPLSSSPRDIAVENELDARQEGAGTDIIIEGAIFFDSHSHYKCANHDSPVIVDIVNVVIEDIIDDLFKFTSDSHAAESNFTQQTVISLGDKYPKKNRLVYHDQDSTYNFCTFESFSVTGHFWADSLQRPTPFMYIKNLISATYSAFMNLLRAMKFGSLTMALSRFLATVGLLTGHTEGVLPHREMMSLSRNVEGGN